MTVTIYHNPDCGTSRNVLAVIEAAGYTPTVINYLQTGWQREPLLALLAAAGLTPREALRETKSPARELGLLEPGVSDDTLIEAMLQHPILVNRPIVVTEKAPACAARPKPCSTSSTAGPPAPSPRKTAA